MTDLTRDELIEQLERTERELQHERDRWAKLERKVHDTLAMVDGKRKATEGVLIEAAEGLPNATPAEHEDRTLGVIMRADEARRAYAIYDAIRSVKIWMDGYL